MKTDFSATKYVTNIQYTGPHFIVVTGGNSYSVSGQLSDSASQKNSHLILPIVNEKQIDQLH